MTTTIAQVGGTAVIVPDLVLGYSASYPTKNVMHAVLGKQSSNVTVNGGGLRTGNITLLFATEATKIAAVALLNAAALFQISSTDITLELQFALTGTLTETLDPESRVAWTVSFDWEEIA